MGGGSCDVCKEAPSKYKCPSCRTPYCSVTCFKNHKDEFCQKIIPQEEINKSSLLEEVTRSSGLLEDGTNCPNDKDQLPSLLESNEIRDALKDPELQKMILKIDDSSEPEKELEKLMEGETFKQLTNKILDIVSPQQ